MVCYCARGGFDLRVGQARSSGHRPKSQGLRRPPGRATWTQIAGSSGEEAEEQPSRGATYLFCHLPGSHSRRKGVPRGHPQWPLAPGPPLPIAIASPLPRLCGPVSGPMETQRNPTVSHGAVRKQLVPLSPTTHSTLAAHTHCSSCHSLLTPCGAGGQQGERGGQKEIRELEAHCKMIPRTCVQSYQSPKTSSLSQAHTQRLSSILIHSQVTWG